MPGKIGSPESVKTKKISWWAHSSLGVEVHIARRKRKRGITEVMRRCEDRSAPARKRLYRKEIEQKISTGPRSDGNKSGARPETMARGSIEKEKRFVRRVMRCINEGGGRGGHACGV